MPSDDQEIQIPVPELLEVMLERLEQELELDMSYSLPGRARFRVNVYYQRDSLGAAFRLIPFEIKSVESLELPGIVADLARYPRGFVVVTGPTGSGTSKTLSSPSPSTRAAS